ncbi:MAG: hypothetical protein ABW128_05210, partial [Rhizorhabdus sp.]
HDAIVYPYGLDYGEGVVWAQMREIMAGRGYGPIDRFPSLVFHYPPVYHVLTALGANGLGMDELASGRLLSVLATIASAGILGFVAAHLAKVDGAGRASWICGLVASLLVFSMMPVLHWSRLMRVDMLALFFGFAGLCCGLVAVSRPRIIHVAALCFVAAVFTKQTSFVPAIAVFATLLALRPRTALAGLATAAIMALGALALTIARFGTGFVDHIVLYNMNTVEWARLQWIVPMLTQHAMFIAVALFALGCRVRRLAGGRLRTAMHCQTLIVAVYLLIATVMLLTIVKSGSSYNYFMEWLCIVAVLAGLGMREVAMLAAARDSRIAPALALLIPLMLAVQSLVLPDTPRDAWRMDATRRRGQDRLAAMIASTRGPVLSNDLALLIRAGKTPQWEPFTFPELARAGLWNDHELIRRIRSHAFALVLTGDDSAKAIAEGYTPDIAAAIAAAYPVTRRVDGVTISLPTPRRVLP